MYRAHTSGSASWMAQWSPVRKGQLFRFSFTGASRSTGKWLTVPMLARQYPRATICGGRRNRKWICHKW